jgi:hypothetical protein
MIHLGRRRNGNEFCGAYGHDFTFDEMRWLAHWLLVRGCNLLMPHAFYYSVRGPRVDERPPDVGPNSAWWGQFGPFAGACSRLCWLNTDSQHVCHIAILGRSDHLPWRAAKFCYEHQLDFNYLEARHLWEDAEAGADGVHIAGPRGGPQGGMYYPLLIVEDEPPDRARPVLEVLERAGRLIRWDSQLGAERLVAAIDRFGLSDAVASPPAAGLRVRHVVKGGKDYYVLFNEAGGAVEVRLELAVAGEGVLLDLWTGGGQPWDADDRLKLERHQCRVLMVRSADKLAAGDPP